MAELLNDTKCPSCGGALGFDPQTQQLKCFSCGEITVFDKTGEVCENELSRDESAEKLSQVWNHTETVSCKSCGGQFVISAGEISGRCVYCGSTRVANLGAFPALVPDGVVPFKITREGASEALKKWAKKRFWAPMDFKKSMQTEKLSGCYLPFYTYDSNTFSSYTAQAGTYYYVTVPYTTVQNGKTVTATRTERRTRWRSVSGNYAKFFDDVWVEAFVGESFLKESYSASMVKPYVPEYLSGFSAQMYTKSVTDGFFEAKEEINSRIRSGIINEINADEVADLRVNTSFDNNTFKLIFVSLWLYSYRYKGKLYSAAVSGLTGNVKGKSPLSVAKILIAVAAAIALIVGICFFL